MSDSVRPHRWQPTRLLCPWDSYDTNNKYRFCWLVLDRNKYYHEEKWEGCSEYFLKLPYESSFTNSNIPSVFLLVISIPTLEKKKATLLLIQKQEAAWATISLCRWLSRKAFSPISCHVIKNSCNISLSRYNRNVYHLLFCLLAYQSLRSFFLSVLLEYNWHTVLPKVYSIMIWLTCIMKWLSQQV